MIDAFDITAFVVFLRALDRNSKFEIEDRSYGSEITQPVRFNSLLQHPLFLNSALLIRRSN